jgi:amino acid adenylation domain-containing protein
VTRNLAEYLERSASRHPSHPAVVAPSGETVSYEELNARADALAGFLAARGIGHGDRVGVVLPKGIPAVVALFGIMKAGAAYVPVDWSAPAERSRRILADCQIRGLVVDSRVLDVSPDEPPAHARLDAIIVCGPGNAKTVGPAIPFERAVMTGQVPPVQPAGPDDLAYVLYTSGSTGLPKGAMISHRNATSFVDWCSAEFAFAPEDRISSNAPFHFDLSVLDLFVTIKHGATLYLVSEELARSPGELVRFVAENQITVWTSTPSVLMLLVQFGQLEVHDVSRLRLVLFGGEVFPVRFLRELRRRWVSPVFYNLYGPTEITTACTFARLPAEIPDDRDEPYPIGFPCTHCEAMVLDDQGNDVEPGGQGVLFISGPSVFGGYWNRPAENAAAFIHRNGQRWYNTGDVVRSDPLDGFFYVGRTDRMVKRRGFRIELGEIETSLYAHPAVREAAAVSVPDENAGVRIVAFVAAHGKQRLSGLDLKVFCATKMPSYMSPDRFVFQEHLPRTSTDKVDYQALVRAAAVALAG